MTMILKNSKIMNIFVNPTERLKILLQELLHEHEFIIYQNNILVLYFKTIIPLGIFVVYS